MIRRKGDWLDSNLEAKTLGISQTETVQTRKPQQPDRPAIQKPSLNELVKASNNQQAVNLKQEIDTLKKQRESLIKEAKNLRKRLLYKEEEREGLASFLESSKRVNKSRFAPLKRMKHNLEFRLSTQAGITLSEEREIVKKVGEINKELDTLSKYVGLERKKEFINKDIESYKARLEVLHKGINDADQKLDELYKALKRLLGIGQQHVSRARRRPSSLMQEINLEDVAIIKKKEEKPKQQ